MSKSKDEENRFASDTQLILATLYRYVTLIGFVIMAIAFLLYTTGLLPATVPAKEVGSYWHLESGTYATETATPVGWEFLANLSSGESLSFGSLGFMAVAIIVCLAIMIGVFFRKSNRLFALIAFLQTTVLVLAASGIVVGH